METSTVYRDTIENKYESKTTNFCSLSKISVQRSFFNALINDRFCKACWLAQNATSHSKILYQKKKGKKAECWRRWRCIFW